ncbi:MAG: PLP-dependent cysteine synthase family protein [Clostridia bacterium]
MYNKSLIGNTPMIKLEYKYKEKIGIVYCKLESYNLTGSIKDRVANYIIVNAKREGILKEKMPIIEATSGNTGISLSALGAYYNHPVYIFMPDWASEERIKLMKLYGAKVKLISKEEGGFLRCIKEANNLSQEINGFLTKQFENKDNVLAHYETTGKEIIEQLPSKIGGFISGVGTGGTLIGIGKRLKEHFDDIKICALEPEKMPIISGGKIMGQHKIEGIGDDFVPELYDKKLIDDVFLINDEDAINMSRKLSKELGLGVGISSGANLIGAIKLEERIKKEVVIVFPDDNKKYLSTDLAQNMSNSSDLLSNDVELLNYEVI